MSILTKGYFCQIDPIAGRIMKGNKRSLVVLLLFHTGSSNPQIYSLDIGFGSNGASVTRFPNPVVSPAAAPQQHRFEAGPPPPSTFHPQPVVAASIQGAASGQGGGNQDGDQVANQGGGNQARHDEALRQNALHRQMLAEVEERHREATLQAVGQRGGDETRSRGADFYVGAGIGATRIPESGKIDIFLKKKSSQLPKKKKEKSKSKAAERKELLNHLKLLAKLEAEVNRLFLRSLRLEAGLKRDEERSGGGGRRRPNLADPRRGA